LKKRLLFYLVVLGLILAFKNASANTCLCPIAGGLNNNTVKAAATKINLFNVSTLSKETAKSAHSQLNNNRLLKDNLAGLDSVTELLRLKLIINTYNYDDILIGFNSAASTKYNGNEDSEYWPGPNAAEGLSSFSSDGFQLSQNYLPLPKQTPLVIRLDAEATNSGPFTLERTQLDSLPPIYEVWLVDNYRKDSLDLRIASSYKFIIDKTDTATFGKNRFYVVVRQNPALGVHLLDFTATKASNGAQVTWKTENEQNHTRFTVEKSTDNGSTFNTLTAFSSGTRGTYSYLDISPPAVADGYRLKIEDINGTISYSDVVTLLYGNPGTNVSNNISVYPNPAGSTINLSINSPSNLSATQIVSSLQGLNQTSGTQSYSIKIINITGSVVKAATSSQPNWQDNVDTLKPGSYIIQVVNNNNNSIVGKCTFIKL
jgi:hypothetical protein